METQVSAYHFCSKRSTVQWFISAIITLLILLMESARTLTPLLENAFFFESDQLQLKHLPIFNSSGLSSFLSAYDVVSVRKESKDRRVVLICAASNGELCGGIADRTRGIAYAVVLALLTNRQLVIHPSLLSNAAVPRMMASNHTLIDDGDGCNPQNVHAFIEDSNPHVYLSTNCNSFDVPTDRVDADMLSLIQQITQECETLYLCGAAVLHNHPTFEKPIGEAGLLVTAMMESILPLNNYTALHIRAGGSQIKINDMTIASVPWPDGYSSELPQMWMDTFQSIPYEGCMKNVAIISDSVRVVSELRFRASNRLVLTHCCNQPLHRDRYQGEGFFFQEVVDLFILARSKRIIGGLGGFAQLGQVWLGRGGPELTRVTTLNEIQHSMKEILADSECTGIG